MLESMNKPWVIMVIAGFVIACIVTVIILISQLCKVKKDIKSMTESDVHHIMTRKSSKVKRELRWVDILMAIAFFAVIALVIICVIFVSESNETAMDTAVITISFTMAAIIPYIIGNSIAKNEVNQIVDKKFETLENKYSTSLFSLTKQNAHTKRMCANLLKNNHPKWAIGWISEALISYSQIEKNYDGSRYIAECIDTLHELASKVIDAGSSDSKKATDEERNINERTLRSLLTMDAYLNTSCSPILKESKNKRSEEYIPYDEIRKVEKALINSMFEGEKLKYTEKYKDKDIHDYIKNREFKEFCTSCKISDLIDNEINESIVLNVVSIICGLYPCCREALMTSCITTF